MYVLTVFLRAKLMFPLFQSISMQGDNFYRKVGSVSLFCPVGGQALGSCFFSSFQGISVTLEGATDAWQGLGMHMEVLPLQTADLLPSMGV